ncbi:unnamed protein product, partial [Mesorhabditis spiculigera]
MVPVNSPPTLRSARRKRSIATSPIAFPSTQPPNSKKPRSWEKPSATLVSFQQFQQMPTDVWLLVMNLFSPVDLINLAHSHSFFKGHITRSPKRWGTVKEVTANYRYSAVEIDAKVYMITTCAGSWDCATSYILAYGNEYEYEKAHDQYDFITGAYEGRCQHIRPKADRDGPSKEDLYTLINNATFDEYGFGPGWKLPAPEEYPEVPKFRTHMALLDINGPKENICKEIAPFDPSSIAVHVDPRGTPGELRTVVLNVTTAFPDLKFLWVHVGREIGELSMLLEVKAPSIVALCWVNEKKVDDDGMRNWFLPDVPIPALAAELVSTLEPTLSTLIQQWERGEREIGYITIYSHNVKGYGMVDWDKMTPEVAKLPGKLAEGKTDTHNLFNNPRLCLIRRFKGSNEGLLIAVTKGILLLSTCDYSFRRDATGHDCLRYLSGANCAQMESLPPRRKYYRDEKLKLHVQSPLSEMERLAHKRHFDACVREFHDQMPYRSIPKHELALHYFLATSESDRTRFLLAPEFGRQLVQYGMDPVMEYYWKHHYDNYL